MKDYYYILGLQMNASFEEIRKAHRKLSQKFHPDKNQGDKYFEERFKDIQEAFEVLNNQERRKIYDQKLNYNSHIEKNLHVKEEELRKKEEELRKRENAIKERSNNFINKDQQYSQKLNFDPKQSQSSYSNPQYQSSGPWVNKPHKTNNFPKAVLGFFAVLAFIIIASVIARQNKESSITTDNNRQETNISDNESKKGREVPLSEIDRREDSIRKVLLGYEGAKLSRNQIEDNVVPASSPNRSASENDKGGSEKYEAQTTSFSSYTDSDNHFTIQYPSDWIRNYNLYSGCVFMAQDPNIPYNINVVVTNNVDATIDDMTMDKMNMKAKQSSTNIRYESERSILINGQIGKEFVVTASTNGNNLKNLVYGFVKNRTLYIITITGLEENFEKTKNNSSVMINTFRLF